MARSSRKPRPDARGFAGAICGVMVSEDVFRQLTGDRAKRLNEAGLFRLKNIAQPVRLYQWRPERRQVAEHRGCNVDCGGANGICTEGRRDRALAGDLRGRLLIRMPRRMGVVIFDGTVKNVETATYDLRGWQPLAALPPVPSVVSRRPVLPETYGGLAAALAEAVSRDA